MCSKKKSVGILSLLLPVSLGGCALTAVLPTVAVVVPLVGAFLQIAVTSGTPSRTSGLITFETSDNLSVGRGSIELDPGVISLAASAVGSKVSTVAQQVVEDCQMACEDAGLDGTTCDAVCTSGACEITLWAAAPGDEETVCTGGARDEYGPFLVAIDDTGRGISVEPPTVTLQSMTIEMLNAGSLAMCVQVVAPDNGNVAVEGLIINVGL